MTRIFILAVSCLFIFGCCKKTPEDCILENIEKAHSNASANMISHICTEKYGAKTSTKIIEDFGPAAPAPNTEDSDKSNLDKNGYIHDPYSK
jgi:hypothetical protein